MVYSVIFVDVMLALFIDVIEEYIAFNVSIAVFAIHFMVLHVKRVAVLALLQI